MQDKYNKDGFVVVDNFLPTDKYDELVEIFNNGKFKEIKQIKENRYDLWKTDNIHFPSIDEDYMANFWSSFEVANNSVTISIYDMYIKPLLERLSNQKNQMVRHQATKYKRNGKDFTRVHYDDYMGSIGYILYLTKHNWKYDWGGQLQILKDDVKTILPHPNRLVIINHSLKNPHWVTPTNKWSKEDRRTITGFCLKSGMSIPETWKNRKDISVKLWKEN